MKERIITVVICFLLIGTGFYTTPWLNFIDQDAASMAAQYPLHDSPQTDTMTEPVDDCMNADDRAEIIADQCNADANSGQYE